jgi:hypothetical protein
MKARIMLGALIMAAVIGSSIGVGYAGGGDTGLGNGGLIFHCYLIQDSAQPSPPLVLLVNDKLDHFPPGPGQGQNVSVGRARLLCTPADGTVVQGSIAAADPFGDQITCYDAPPVGSSNDVVTLTDSFVGSQTVRLGPPQFLCISAVCTTGPCAHQP